MSDLGFLLCLLVVELMLAGWVLLRIGIRPMPTLIMIYCMLAQIILYLSKEGYFTYSFFEVWSKGGIYINFRNALAVYLFIIVAGAIASLIERRGHVAIRERMNSFTLPSGTLIQRANMIIIPVVLLYMMTVAATIDWNLAWYNTAYLTMTTPQLIVTVDSGIARSAFAAFVLVGIASSALAALNLSSRQLLSGLFYAAIALFIFFYLFSAHSRSAAVIPTIFVVVQLFSQSKRRRNRFVPYLLILLAATSIITALQGRSRNEHGLSTASDNINYMLRDGAGSAIQELVANVFEGPFVLVEALSLEPRYSTPYKVLSFSPLPSFIDGFSSVRGDNKVLRLHEAAPLSGLIELYNFGVFFIALAVALYFFAIYLNAQIYMISKNAYIAGNFLIFMSAYMIGAYPVRDSFKVIWISVALSGAYLYRNRQKRNHKRKVRRGWREPVLSKRSR